MAIQWSGANYVGYQMKTVTGGVWSATVLGKGVTEAQFTRNKLLYDTLRATR
jgi:isocitrate lyase